jgi:hypothetical protein
VTLNYNKNNFQLYNLAENSGETTNIYAEHPKIAKRMTKAFKAWNASVEASFAGNDYPESFDPAPNPKHGKWSDTEQYKPYVAEFEKRQDAAKKVGQ